MTDYGDRPRPTTRKDTAPQTGAVEINMVKSMTFNKSMTQRNFDEHMANPTDRFTPLNDLATLDAIVGDCMFTTQQMQANSTKLGITCFQGMELPDGWKNSTVAKTQITPLGIIGAKGGYRARPGMTSATVLDGEVSVIVDGEFKVKNTAHMGIGAVWKQKFASLAAQNIWPDQEDHRWLRAIDEGRQDLSAGDQLVLDLFTFDTEATLGGGGKAGYMNPTDPDYWQVYKHTLPPYLRNKPRYVLRYRKMSEYEETTLRTMYNTLETLRTCISIVQTAKTLSGNGIDVTEFGGSITARLIELDFNQEIHGVMDNLREKIYGVNWPRFTVKEGGTFNNDVIISVSPF